MSLASQISLVATRAAQECKAIRTWVTTNFMAATNTLDAIASTNPTSGDIAIGANSVVTTRVGSASNRFLTFQTTGSLASSEMVLLGVSVRACSTVNISTGAVTVIDGVTLATGDPVLLVAQSAPAQNGLYIYSGSSSLFRAGVTNYGTAQHVAAASPVSVREGTSNGGSRWSTTWRTTDTLGTTAMTWVSDNQPLNAIAAATPTTADVNLGAFGIALDNVGMRTEYGTTQPATPTTGATLFTRSRARTLPAVMDRFGQDTILQPNFFSNKIVLISAQPSANTLTAIGTVPATVATLAAVTPVTTTTFDASLVRLRSSSATAINVAGFVTGSSNTWHLSANAGQGGFFVVWRFAAAVSTATSRGLVAMAQMPANTLASDPSTLFATGIVVGFACDSADTNWSFFCNDGAAGVTKTTLGTNFPKSSTSTYEFSLYAPSGAGQLVYYAARRLSDGVATTGGPITTNLPANGAGMNHYAGIGSGPSSAAVVSLDFQSVYIETDN